MQTMAASARCPASAPRKATVCAEPVTGNDRGRLGSSLGHASGHSKPTAHEKGEEGTVRVLGEGAEPKGQEKEMWESLGTELRPGITLLQQQESGWISKTSHLGAWWRASAFRV